MRGGFARSGRPRKRDSRAGYRRGDETRTRLLEQALLLFGERGFEATSTRQIAAAAGTTTPSLQYYFKNKEGLYLACIERITSLMWQRLAPAVSAAEAALADDQPLEKLIDCFVAIQTRLLELTYSVSDASHFLLVVLRQQAGIGPRSGFNLLYKHLIRPLDGINCALIGRVIGRPADDEETIIRHVALSGQSAIFVLSKRTALKALRWKRIGKAEAARLTGVLADQTRLFLRAVAAAANLPPSPMSSPSINGE